MWRQSLVDTVRYCGAIVALVGIPQILFWWGNAHYRLMKLVRKKAIFSNYYYYYYYCRFYCFIEFFKYIFNKLLI